MDNKKQQQGQKGSNGNNQSGQKGNIVNQQQPQQPQKGQNGYQQKTGNFPAKNQPQQDGNKNPNPSKNTPYKK